MNVEVKKLPKSQVEITATVPAEKLAECRKQACEEISRDLKIKGFRPGHVPVHVLEQYVEAKYIDAHAQEIALKRTYSEIVKKEGLPVVSRPQVEIVSQEPFTFKATVATLPEVTLSDYQKITIKKNEQKVSEKEVNEVLDDIVRRQTTYVDADRAAKKGDRVEADFEGFDKDGTSLENTKSKNHPIILGENMMIPGFEDKLIGLRKDEKKEFDITFPKDYHAENFKGRKVHFKVEIKRIEEPQKPELNEEFVEKVTGTKQPLETLKKDIEENIQIRKNTEARREREEKYLEELLKHTKLELPDQLIQEEAEHILHEMKHDIEARGQEFQHMLEKAKTTEEELLKKYHTEAERRIKLRLILQKIVEAEAVTVADEELEKEFLTLISRYPEAEQKKLKAQYQSGELRYQLYNRLALEKLFEKLVHKD